MGVKHNKYVTLKERFDDKYKINTENGCWEWTGALNENGYGRLTYNGKIAGAHRVSYIIHKGEILDGLFVCHECDNPSCVNPDHLWLGTNDDNMKDSFDKGRKKTATCPGITMYDKGCRCQGCVELHRKMSTEKMRIWRAKKKELLLTLK